MSRKSREGEGGRREWGVLGFVVVELRVCVLVIGCSFFCICFDGGSLRFCRFRLGWSLYLFIMFNMLYVLLSYFLSLMRTPWRRASQVFYLWEFNISELHLSWYYMIPQSITPSGSPAPTRPNMAWPNMTSPSSVWSVAVEFLRESWRSGGPLTVLLRREASVVGWGSRGEGGGCDGRGKEE